MEEFLRIWHDDPVVLLRNDYEAHIETDFRGAPYCLFPVNSAITQTVRRGTPFIIGGQDQPSIRYFATIRRSLGFGTSFVQLNAFTKRRRLFRADHHEWPTLLIRLPNEFIDMELPDNLAPYYREVARILRRREPSSLEIFGKYIRQVAKRYLTRRRATKTPSIPLQTV